MVADTVFRSLADTEGNVTQITFNPARAAITSIDVCDRQNAVLYALPIATALAGTPQSIFQISFRRLDLAQLTNNQPDTGRVVYTIQSNKNPTPTIGNNSWSYRYAITATVIQAGGNAPALPAFDAINVDVTARAASDAPSKGWIDFDLQFAYPPQIANNDARYGWEVVVSYPQVALQPSASSLIALHPAGRIGPLSAMRTPVGGNTMPVQFAALYQLGSSGTLNSVQGVAFAATDENGHEKRLEMAPAPTAADGFRVSLGLVCPIHLKQNAYVRPNAFKLSAGDALGYGGAKMTFRIRGFQLKGMVDGAPVNWMDVANVYRVWARTRTSTLWRKNNPTARTGTPLEKMAPYTIACNYALDGAVDAGSEAQTQVARWLEQHPMVQGDPDISGNTNESLPSLLNRVQSVFTPANENPVPLEAQIWGFEMGGYYRQLGGWPPLTDLLGAQLTAMDGEAVVELDGQSAMVAVAKLSAFVLGSLHSSAKPKQRGKANTQPRWPRIDVVSLPNPNGGARSLATCPGGYILYRPEAHKARGELQPTVPGGYIPYWLRPRSGTAPLASSRTRYIEPHVDDYIPWYARPKNTAPLVGSGATSKYIEPHVDDYIPWYARPKLVGVAALIRGSAIAAAIDENVIPAVVVLNSSSQTSRFKAVLDTLNNAGVAPCITTTPMAMGFHRWRFRGHRIQVGAVWQDAIPYDFPILMRGALSNIANTTGRMLQLNESHPDVSVWAAQAKRLANGDTIENHNALGGIYQLDQRALCPTAEVETRYVNGWLHNGDNSGILDYGARLVELMLHNYDTHVCYDRRHQHVTSGTSASYDNAIGYGPWYVRRIQSMLSKVNDLRATLHKQFSLANEFACNELLAAYFDEWYDRVSSAAVFNNTSDGTFAVPFFQFIFSELLSARMDMIQYDTLSHPGYLERRNTSTAAQPGYMLSTDRDTDTAQSPTLADWRTAATQYFNQNFTVERYGLAPRNYTTASGSYSYARGVQAVMNLRSVFFRIGAAAVLGERMLLPASWLELPNDYLQEAITMTARAVRCHMQFAAVFRSGAILGPAYITSSNRTLTAWRIPWRTFEDVQQLADNTINPHATADEQRLPLADRISRATDQDQAAYRVSLNQIQTRVWQKGTTALYVLVNIGNTNVPVSFQYTHGFSSAARTRTIYTFANNGVPQVSAAKSVVLGEIEMLTMPARYVIAVAIS